MRLKPTIQPSHFSCVRVTKSAEPQTFNQSLPSNVPKIFPAASLLCCRLRSAPMYGIHPLNWLQFGEEAAWRRNCKSCNINIRRLFLLYCTHSRNHIACGKHIGPNKRLEQMGLGEEDRETLCKTLQGSFLHSLGGGTQTSPLDGEQCQPYTCLGSGH